MVRLRGRVCSRPLPTKVGVGSRPARDGHPPADRQRRVTRAAAARPYGRPWVQTGQTIDE